MDLGHTLLIACLAAALERLVGLPRIFQQLFGHPVQWFGRLITRLDTGLNRPGGRPAWQCFKGGLALTILLALSAVFTLIIAGLARALPHYGAGIEALLAVPFLAQRELGACVGKVADALETNLEDGRAAVRHIVGRDPSGLDEPGIARAAIESLAENTCDGIVAPAFWLALFGLPGIVVYKAINTADSMIGYRNDQYIDFGKAAARLDDLVNLVPARLTAVLLAAAQSLTSPARAAAALECMWRDAGKNPSPNAGWPEAAMAGALNIRLGGPRAYAGQSVDMAWIGSGKKDLDAADIRAALGLYTRTITVLVGVLFALWLFW